MLQIKKKTLSRAEWYSDSQRTYRYIYHKDDYFEGGIGLISFVGLEKPDTVPSKGGELCIADNGYHWLELAPINSNVVLTAMFDKENHIFQCYFDITKENIVASDGDATFLDAFLDVVVTGYNEPVVLDLDELDLALSNEVITQKEHDKYMDESHKLISALNKNRDKFYEILTEYFYMISNSNNPKN